ncbi:hypothetical protein QSH18_03540 [Xanthomonas sp. NCPPB 2654]|uniref:hypothetical protein n=1 Tax=unclassified Xanthomonas TaxID=2643310 RepID=UPI0021E0388B|nr:MULTISPECIES: hypothetical protein [unclassified Xanthomonas]MDL5364671.1 hypothetical protein [Xanthomonas sp. NCPPB 2654]UYC21985.1 hypothetical protein NUG20_06745 [Xanthomonas sp. CFBP 8443]
MRQRVAGVSRGSLAGCALGLLALSFAACAQWHDRQGTPVADSAGRAHDKNFAATVHVADEAAFARFGKEWTETDSRHGPQLRTTERVRRGKPIRVVVLYSGCAPSPNNDGACDAQLRLRMLGPDGHVALQEPARPLTTGGKPAAPGMLELAPLSLQIRFEPADPLGTYTLHATLNDPSQDAWVRVQTQVELVAD